MERYKDHESYVEMILSDQVGRVERQVEQYFQRLHNKLFSQNGVLFLGLGLDAKSWRSEVTDLA